LLERPGIGIGLSGTVFFVSGPRQVFANQPGWLAGTFLGPAYLFQRASVYLEPNINRDFVNPLSTIARATPGKGFGRWKCGATKKSLPGGGPMVIKKDRDDFDY